MPALWSIWTPEWNIWVWVQFSDRCLLRTLTQKENNGKEDCSCFAIIRSKAKQERGLDVSEPVHGLQWVVFVQWRLYTCLAAHSGINLFHNSEMLETCFRLTLYLNHRHPSPNFPLDSPLIWLPLQWNEGQRACTPHMLSCKTSPLSPKKFNMARKHEHSWPVSTLRTVLTGGGGE